MSVNLFQERRNIILKLFLESGVRPKPSEWELNGGESAKLLALALAAWGLTKYFDHVSLIFLGGGPFDAAA